MVQAMAKIKYTTTLSSNAVAVVVQSLSVVQLLSRV